MRGGEETDVESSLKYLGDTHFLFSHIRQEMKVFLLRYCLLSFLHKTLGLCILFVVACKQEVEVLVRRRIRM